MESSAAQQALYTALGWPVPRFAHVPLAVGPSGVKLSKANEAPPTTLSPPGEILVTALSHLGQPVHDLDKRDNPASILSAAVSRWSWAIVPRAAHVPLTGQLSGY